MSNEKLLTPQDLAERWGLHRASVLRLYHRGLLPGVVLFRGRGRTTARFRLAALQDKEAAFARWRVENPGKPGAPTTRGYSETAIALPGLWADFDIQSPAHKSENLPPTKEAARALLREFPPTPTLVVDSGHGV